MEGSKLDQIKAQFVHVDPTVIESLAEVHELASLPKLLDIMYPVEEEDQDRMLGEDSEHDSGLDPNDVSSFHLSLNDTGQNYFD